MSDAKRQCGERPYVSSSAESRRREGELRHKSETRINNIEGPLPSSVTGKAPSFQASDRTGAVNRGFSVPTEKETDATKIQQRLKQIRFGKNTLGYDNYTKAVKRYIVPLGRA